MEIKEVIDNWFQKKGVFHDARFRIPNFRELLLSIKEAGFGGGSINEEIAMHIVNGLGRELPELAKMQLNQIIIMELGAASEKVFASKSGFEEGGLVEEKFNKPAKDLDVTYMAESESIVIDRSEIKNKEFDLDVLDEFGLDIKDLQNE